MLLASCFLLLASCFRLTCMALALFSLLLLLLLCVALAARRPTCFFFGALFFFCGFELRALVSLGVSGHRRALPRAPRPRSPGLPDPPVCSGPLACCCPPAKVRERESTDPRPTALHTPGGVLSSFCRSRSIACSIACSILFPSRDIREKTSTMQAGERHSVFQQEGLKGLGCPHVFPTQFYE